MQDISPNNNQSASTTNTMNPRNISAQSAGSITPTIVSQSNADRRRRAAAEREERRRQSLAENVERAEVEREYQRLRDAEEAANKKAEERRARAKKEILTFWSGGYYIPSENRDVPVTKTQESIFDYYGGKSFTGASEPLKVPEELKAFTTMNSGSMSKDYNAAYAGLQKLVEHVNTLYKQEAQENRQIEQARMIERIAKDTFFGRTPSYSPMSTEAREAHERLIRDPSTDAETRTNLMNDLKADSEYVSSHGGGVQLSAAEEKNLSENWYRGGTKEEKQIAAAYLSAAGSTYGKEDFNRAQSNVYVNQTEKARDALLRRYQGNSEINNKDNTTATTAALRANQAGAAEVLSDLTESRSRLGMTNTEKAQLSAAAERQFAKQDAAVKAAMKDNPYIREDTDTAQYAESILRVVGDDRVNLSNDAFLREQALTERKYGGTQWTSAGGESAADALSAGKSESSYSAFKSAGEDDNEYILIDSAGKKRYTLKQDNSGAFKIFGWSGDIVASSDTAQGLPSALKNLGIPFDEKSFNVFSPDSDSTVVNLSEETDITGIDTAAAFKSGILGTFRTNEEIAKAEGARRAAAEEITQQKALSELDAALNDSQGYTLRIQGNAVDMPQSAAETKRAEPSILSDAVVMAGAMAGALPVTMAAKSAYDLFSNPPKTILDEWAAEDAIADSSKRVEALTYGGSDGDRDVEGLFGSAREYADVVEGLVESGELIAGSKQKSLLLPDEENPENSVYTYTDLEWSDKASKESVEKFFNAERNLKTAGAALTAAITDYNAKVGNKEKVSEDVWWGVPKIARDFTQTYLPEAEKVYPYVNAAELFKSDLRQRLIINDVVKGVLSGNAKYENTSDFIQKEVYEARPLMSWYYDYRAFRDEPVEYTAIFGAGYAAPYLLLGGAKAVGKAAPHIQGTIIDPIANTQLAQKSSKYVSDVLKSIPPSPVSVRMGSANLLFNADKGLGGQVDSLMFIRRTGNYETATPIVSRLNYIQGGKVTGTRYFRGLNDVEIKPNKLSFGGMPYVLREPEKVAFAKAALENVGDTQSLERLKLFDLQSRYLQNSDPIVMQNIKPHIAEILSAKGVKNADAVSNAIVNTMSKYRVYSQSSLTQRVIGEELGDVGLTRTPRDLDLFTEAADKFNDEVTAAINKAAGKDIVFVEDGKVLWKSDKSELFDTHEMGQFDSLSAFAPGGIRMERYYVPGTKIQGTSLQTQFLNKRSGTGVLLPEPRVYSGAGAFDTGGSGIGYLMPAHAGRVKDVADYYIAGRVLANQMKLRGDKYADAFRDVLEKSIETYGDDTARQLRSEYESHLNRLQKSGVEMKVFEGEVIPVKDTPYFVRKPSKNLNPMNLDEKSFKNKGVEDAVKWTKANANANNLVGVPIGLYLTAGFATTAASKFVEGEDSAREFVSHEVVPMLIGGYLGGRGAQSLAKQLAFRGRTNYIPIKTIASEPIISGEKIFPMFEYKGDEISKANYLKAYGRGGNAMMRAEDLGVTSENAKMFAYRSESQFPDEVRPGVSRVNPTTYILQDKSEVFSGSAASEASLHFTRALYDETFNVDLPFGLNILPMKTKIPYSKLILSTQEVADVPHGLGITRTEEFVKKNVPIGKYQGVSTWTARRDTIIAEDEITTQPYAEYQILDRSFRTKWFDKDIAVDVVGMIPKGAKETDVKISIEPSKFKEPTAQEQFKDLDIDELFGSTISTGLTTQSPELWYPVNKAKFRQVKKIIQGNTQTQDTQKIEYLNEQIDYISDLWDAQFKKDYEKTISLKLDKPKLKPKTKDQNMGSTLKHIYGNDFDLHLYQSNKSVIEKAENTEKVDQLIHNIDALEKDLDSYVYFKPIYSHSIIKRVTRRGRGGNPFTANAILPGTKASGFTRMTQATTAAERQTPRTFTGESKTQSTEPKSQSSFKSLISTTSTKTAKTSKTKASSTGTGIFSLRTSSTPVYTSTKTGTSKITDVFSSGSTGSTRRSESPISRSSRGKSRSRSSSGSSYSTPKLRIFDPPKRRTPKIKLDKNTDRRKEEEYNVFTIENVDLPILRGEEALTGRALPKHELPANRKKVYQFGNIFTTKKPKAFNNSKKKGFRI